MAAEGWMYLAIVIDFFLPRMVGGHIGKCVTADLICKTVYAEAKQRNPSRWPGDIKNWHVLESVVLTPRQLS